MAAGSRILLVVRGLDPVGTGRQVELAAAGLAAAGHEVAVALTSAGGSLGERLAHAGHAVHRVGPRPIVDPLCGALQRRRCSGDAPTLASFAHAG